ncbi:MAG: hypothetical protein ABTS22_09545 [Accumulibacter sp.]|uniref:hypothetical protein n=1 Tax=Accumulibacter sp. TaxID=2053492 RepID=UPI0029EFB964|nr:hypothetical protein [Accumulibacter sp.]
MNPKNKLPSWLKPKTSGQSIAFFVGWYTEEQWGTIKKTAIDADKFEATYAEWLRVAEKALQDLRASGALVEKYYINADDLLAWCLVNNRINEGAARAEFVTQQAKRDSNNAPH